MNCIEQSSVCLYSVLPMLKQIDRIFSVLYCNDVSLSPSSIKHESVIFLRFYHVVLHFQGTGSGNLLPVDACLLTSFFFAKFFCSISHRCSVEM